jgi:small subunit ribosomal protein S18
MAAHGKDRSRSKTNDLKNRPRRGRPKVCLFCVQHVLWVDYKDTNLLRRFMTDRGKIKARASTGTCAQHQRDVAHAIKTARELALLPYLVRTLSADKAAGRRGRGPGRPADQPNGSTAADTPDGEAEPEAATEDGPALSAPDLEVGDAGPR